MKKFVKSLITVICSLILTLSFTGCGGGPGNASSDGTVIDGGEGDNADVTLTIGIADFGYGYSWLTEMAKVFSVANGGIKISIKPTVLPHSLLEQLNGGLEGYDLYFMTSGLLDAYDKGTFVEIDDVFSSVPEGETKTVAEKMDSAFLESCYSKKAGHYVQMKWGDSYYGLVVNRTTLDALFGKDNYTIPRTTDEWIDMSKDIRTKNAYSHVFSTAESYMPALFDTLWNQYDSESYLNYYEGKYHNSQGELVDADNGQSLEVPGKLEALKVLETLMKKSNAYAHAYCNSMSFSEAQAAFLGLGYGFADTKPVAFMINAGWLENESKGLLMDNPQDLYFARMPIISSIIDVLPDKSVADDEELSALIKAIDEKNTALVGENYNVTQADYDYVKKARYTVLNNGVAHNAGILANSSNKEWAKKFLTFFASDAAAQIYSNVLGGLTLPFGYTPKMTDTTSAFIRSLTELKSDNINIIDTEQRRLTSHGTNIMGISNYSGWSGAFFAGTTTAQKIYQEDITTYKNQWAYLTGITK